MFLRVLLFRVVAITASILVAELSRIPFRRLPGLRVCPRSTLFSTGEFVVTLWAFSEGAGCAAAGEVRSRRVFLFGYLFVRSPAVFSVLSWR